MDDILRGLYFCFAYIYDILRASSRQEEHGENLRQIFTRLQNYGVAINSEKRVWGQLEVEFLSHLVLRRNVPLTCDDHSDQNIP